MPDTLLSPGEILKTRRKEMNLSIREVENATSIRAQHIQAIEEGNISQVISPIYAQGFVKQYASFLGLDGEQLVNDHQDLFQKQKDEPYPFGIGTLESRTGGNHGASPLPNMTWAVGAGVILAAAWFFAKYLEVL